MKHRTWISALVMGALFTANAAEYAVTSNLDDGEGTLRQLIAGAHPGDTIIIPQDMSVTLDSRISITRETDLTIIAAGTGATLIGNRASESFTNGMFYVNHPQARLAFNNLTFTNGYSRGNGGVFYIQNGVSNGTTIANCVFLANTAENGGAIYLEQAIRLNDCAFTNNTAAVSGGCFSLGMDNPYEANVKRSGILLSDNCDFFNNSATRYGGILTTTELSKWPMLDITRWHCVSNTATRGGCFNIAALSFIQDSTFERNSSGTGGGNVAYLYRGKRTTFDACTFRDNTGSNALLESKVALSIENSIFENNTGVNINLNLDSNATYDDDMIIRNSVFRRGVTSYITTGGSRPLKKVHISDCAFYDAVGIGDPNNYAISHATVSITHAGRIERCLFKLADTANRTYGTTLLYAANSAGATNTIVNCTFSRNPDAPAQHLRKAINVGNASGYYNIQFCTFTGFWGSHGAIRLYSAAASTTRLLGCAFDKNMARISNVLTLVDLSNAALSVQNCSFTMPETSLLTLPGGAYDNNLFDTDPLLSPLADNDGPLLPDATALQTHAFAPRSPLRNAGGIIDIPPTDARGMPRPDTSAHLADIGAYEYQPQIGTLIIAH